MLFRSKEDLGKAYWDEMYKKRHEVLEGKVYNADRVLPPPFQNDRFFKVSVCLWDEAEGKYSKSTGNYIIPALTLVDAVRLMRHHLNEMDSRRGRDGINDITSISKANIDFAIPQSYAEAWCEKKYGESNDY